MVPSSRLPQPRPPVADPALARPDWTKAQPRDTARLWLDKNENLDPELARVVSNIMRTLPDEAYNTYPDTAALYDKLAASVGCGPDNLLLAAGSDGVIRSVFEAYVGEGDGVLHTAPTFAMYSVYARMYGARTIALAYVPSPSGPLLRAETMIETIRAQAPKLVCLPNPDSPTGTVFPLDELTAIVDAAGEVGALILVDEAYWPFHPESAVGLIEQAPHLVVARSAGKAWGCAGLRIGWAIASPEVAVMLHKVRPMYEVNTMAVHAFLRLLDHEGDMRASVARLEAGKKLFLESLEGLGLRVLKGAGNFSHVAFGAHAAAIHEALAPIAYYRRDFAEPCLAGFSRFSSTTPHLFRPVIDRVASVIRR